MRRLADVVAILMTVSGGTAAAAPGRFGENCRGVERVRTGGGMPRRLPYAIVLGIDPARRTYCYSACTPAQTYPIKTVTGPLLVLADLDTDGQIRHIVLDRANGMLIDHQRIAMGPITVARDAEARCVPAAFP